MRRCQLLYAVLLLLVCAVSGAAADEPRKVVLIAGPKSHGPVGNGLHDYPWSVKLLKVMLDNSNVSGQVRVEFHLDGFPRDPRTLDDADTIMVISDGRDGDKFVEAPHFRTAANLQAVQKQIDRGCGFLTFHFSTFAPDQYAKQICDWSGAYFDWETDGARKWYSAIQHKTTKVLPTSPEHPVLTGVKPFEMREEFYFNMRFSPEGKPVQGLTPIWTVPELPGREGDGNVVAWAKQRKNGGRGFGTTCGHFYDNWKHDSFRRMILNAIVWTSGLDVPADGVTARYYSHAEITAALAGIEGTAQAKVDEKPIRALLLTGNEAHKWHNWEKSTPLVKEALERDPRIRVDVTLDPEDFGKKDLSQYDLIVQNNYANWQDPTPLSDKSRTAFMNFLQNGGGLILIHFADGAWHFSLPNAGASDWPEYRKISRRQWNHHGTGEAKSGHDAYGTYTVKVTDVEHPVTDGLADFEITDELYYRQDGKEPVVPLLTGRSKDTKRDEPLAYEYRYGKGRIFQTLLGHSEKTWQMFESREFLRRAAAWVANRSVLQLEKSEDPIEIPKAAQAPPPANKPTLAEGRFGKALDATAGGVFVGAKPVHRDAPVSVECWTKLNSKSGFNILIASEVKASKTHWEMYSFAGTGAFAVYLPGRGGEYRSEVNIADGKWHHVGMTLEPKRIRMFVDGKQVLDRPLPGEPARSESGAIAFGQLVEGGIGCAGLVDEVRFSRGVRRFDSLPDKELVSDDETVGLWRFEELIDGKSVRDESPLKVSSASAASQAVATASQPAKKEEDNHWGRDKVGFHWTEDDSVDGRWQKTDIGRWLANFVVIPEGHGRKMLNIRVGPKQEATVSFDTEHCRMRAAWKGGFLRFNPARYGIIAPPAPDGEILFATPERPGWNDGAETQFRGMYVNGDRVVLSYSVGSVEIRESPWMHTDGDQIAIARTIEIGPGPELTLRVLDQPGDDTSVGGRLNNATGSITKGERKWRVATVGWPDIRGTARKGTGRASIDFRIPARQEARRFQLLYWIEDPQNDHAFAKLFTEQHAIESLAPLLKPGERQWTERIVTRGVRSRDETSPYVIDSITLPFDNPYQALLFVGGHDFFANGDIAVCTVHGDVWRVSGIDDDLEKLVWTRHATGLFHPLGLKIVREGGHEFVYVLGRDQITKLHDRNADGEADFYECFSNLHYTSAGGHDYVTCLERDPAGNFWIAHATQGVLRISKDGKKLDVVATGLRNPNGLGLSPDGSVVTAAPQEGEWTPASAIFEVKPGRHFGFPGPKKARNRPLGYDPPLVWLPRRVDNSSGGQVWGEGNRWGPIRGMLHLSFGQCSMMVVNREPQDPAAPETAEIPRIDSTGSLPEKLFPYDDHDHQGGVVEFPLTFDSGVCRGRFSPHDGQLYVSGLRGWVSSAVQDGCLQRVRYTGRPVCMPSEVRPLANGIRLKFTQPLDPDIAESRGSFHVEQWNYRYRADYGSPEFRVSDPDQEGRDEIRVRSATLLDDRTVFLELPNLKPVHQIAVSWSLKTEDGAGARQTWYGTIHRVPTESIPEDELNRSVEPGELSDTEIGRLRSGLALVFKQGETTDSRRSRMAAFVSRRGQAPTPLLKPGSFLATWNGFVRVPLRTDVSFSFEGRGHATLNINDTEVLTAEGDLGLANPAPVSLQGGFNRLQLRFRPTTDGDSRIRLMWESSEFSREPVPPTVLFHQSDDATLLAGEQLRRGRELFASLQCFQCHGPEPGQNRTEMLELSSHGPRLTDLHWQLNRNWIENWLLDPRRVQNHASMPAMLGADSSSARRDARDLAAWLTRPSDQPQPAPHDFKAGLVSAENGERLFEELACISCHRLTPPGEPDDFNRRSLHFARSKFQANALSRFLEKPQHRNPWVRMPDFGLSAVESASLAKFLTRDAPGSVASIRTGSPTSETPADPERGARLFRERGCIHCHEASGVRRAMPKSSVPMVDVASAAGCLSSQPHGRSGVPQYTLSVSDRAALVRFASTTRESLHRFDAVESSSRLVRSLQCDRCHDRDLERSPRQLIVVTDGVTGRPPEQLPNLTWTGEKLHAKWMRDFLAGRGKRKLRPWTRTRMPAFPVWADALADGLAAEHGVAMERATVESINLDLAARGAFLTRKSPGLDCRQCHAVGNQQPTGDDRTKIALGINFAETRNRLRPEYYRMFLLDPPRFDIGTKMPKLAVDGKHTKVTTILGGDARKQFDAIWHFIQSLEQPGQPRR